LLISVSFPPLLRGPPGGGSRRRKPTGLAPFATVFRWVPSNLEGNGVHDLVPRLPWGWLATSRWRAPTGHEIRLAPSRWQVASGDTDFGCVRVLSKPRRGSPAAVSGPWNRQARFPLAGKGLEAAGGPVNLPAVSPRPRSRLAVAGGREALKPSWMPMICLGTANSPPLFKR
jgi:hypothetical protein